MINHILHTAGLNIMIAEALVKDLDPAQMTTQPHGLVNHPAWSLGHLATSAHSTCALLGIEASVPDGWKDTFKAGTAPDPDPAANPSKDELLGALKSLHAKIGEALPGIDPATLAAQTANENTRKFFPTVGDQVVFMLTGHEMDHLGQIAAWRRAMSLPPAF